MCVCSISAERNVFFMTILLLYFSEKMDKLIQQIKTFGKEERKWTEIPS